MSYVLESSKHPENYLLFKHGSSPRVVNLSSAPKALNRSSTISKSLKEAYGSWKVCSLEDMIGTVGIIGRY